MAELVCEILIDASPETIWPFLTEPGKHVEWDGTVAEIDPRPGGAYRVLVAGLFQSAGEYVEVVEKEKVVFTFGWEQDGHGIPPGSTTVEITLHPRGDQTLVRLVHRGSPTTPSTSTARAGTTTSAGWPSLPPGANPAPTCRYPNPGRAPEHRTPMCR